MHQRQRFDELTRTRAWQVREAECDSFETAWPLMLEAAQWIEQVLGRGSRCEIALCDYARRQERLIASNPQPDARSSASLCFPFPMLHARHGYLGMVRVYVPPTQRLTEATWAAIECFVASLRRISTIVHLETLTRLDGLTRLPKMSDFRLHAERELARAASREQQNPSALLLVDLDDLWLINETCQRDAGSDAIQQVALTLKAAERKIGRGAYTAHRWGEEFLVLVPGVNQTRAREIGTEINHQIRQIRIQAQGRDVGVTVSIGVAMFPDNAQRLESLFEKAELALRLAKDTARIARVRLATMPRLVPRSVGRWRIASSRVRPNCEDGNLPRQGSWRPSRELFRQRPSPNACS
jgi:diguanylate cyclase (GGDEF)-like protein